MDSAPAAARTPAAPHACGACRDGKTLFPFAMAFQPIVDLEHQSIVAHEALVRGPDGAPAASILAQVDDTNRYAFDQAIRVRAIERAAALGLHAAPGCRLNINFLPGAVYEPRACLRLTLEAARRTGFPPDRLTFELVEHEQLVDLAHTKRIIAEYRRHGFQIALDDFGTGYSGLDRLAELRPDIVKLDRALIKDCDRDHYRLAIVRSVLSLGREAGFRVICEGMERREEVEALRDVGARYLQGFHFARPRFDALVRDRDAFRAMH